jgi:hypothetical protein
MRNDTLVAVDTAKKVFEVGVSDRPGHVARRRRLERYEFTGVLRPAAAGDGGDGGVWLGPILGAPDRGVGARGGAAAVAVRQGSTRCRSSL